MFHFYNAGSTYDIYIQFGICVEKPEHGKKLAGIDEPGLQKQKI